MNAGQAELMGPVDSSSVGSTEYELPQLDRHFTKLRNSMRENILEHMLRKLKITDWQLLELVERLEEILYRKFPNKNDYYNMMKRPVEPQFHFAIKAFNGQNQHNRQKQQMSRKVGSKFLLDQMNCLVELAEKQHSSFLDFCTRVNPPGCSIPDVMTLISECGAAYGTNEHFIATELFVKREQGEMFLTIPTAKDRLEWLRRKHNAKYGHQLNNIRMSSKTFLVSCVPYVQLNTGFDN